MNKFSSKVGVILSAVGSAVGMANVWGFPYKFQEGGLVFLIAYVLFIGLFSHVGLVSEFAIGRMTRSGALGAYDYSFKKAGKNSTIGKYIGYIPMLALFAISVGYSIIVAYVLKALIDSVTGLLFNVDPGVWFDGFSMEPYSVMLLHFIVIVIAILTCFGGASTIEKSNKIMMPAFFILFVILAIRIATLDNAGAGYRYMFRLDMDKLNLNTIVAAMGQAFFSLSITGSTLVVFGAYISKDVDIVDSSKKTGMLDTLAALISSSVVIPALTVFGMDQVGGPGLLFVALPTIFQNIRLGRIFSIILYLAVILAGISSLQSMFEAVTGSLILRFPKLSRKKNLISLALIAFLLGVNMETIDRFGKYMDIVSIYIIPIGASIGAFTWFYILGKDELLGEVNIGSTEKIGNSWHKVGKYIYVPLAIILTLLALIFKISF